MAEKNSLALLAGQARQILGPSQPGSNARGDNAEYLRQALVTLVKSRDEATTALSDAKSRMAEVGGPRKKV